MTRFYTYCGFHICAAFLDGEFDALQDKFPLAMHIAGKDKRVGDIEGYSQHPPFQEGAQGYPAVGLCKLIWRLTRYAPCGKKWEGGAGGWDDTM